MQFKKVTPRPCAAADVRRSEDGRHIVLTFAFPVTPGAQALSQSVPLVLTPLQAADLVKRLADMLLPPQPAPPRSRH
ncbi:MAG: hypothetical protein KAY56_11225 [Inhella sp.]|nr:hypothetical protein [Inhella sp.]